MSELGWWLSYKKINKSRKNLLTGSFRASSVLIYSEIQNPLAQPRNLIGGHVISAFIGITMFKLFPDTMWLTASLSVALSIVCMQFTKTMYPPGGATSLIAVMGTEKVKPLGYLHVLFPVFTGALILLMVALIFNNVTAHRNYPTKRINKKKLIKRLLGS